jgi:broad specificity phosphatase PhoE
MKIFLIRHCESVKTFDDIVLSDFGHQEAEALAFKLSEIPIDKIFVSEHTRALETLEPFKKKNTGVPVIKTADLREIYRVIVGGPIREGTSKDRETNDSERAMRIWEVLKKEKGNVAVFCHGNIIRFFLMMSLNIKPNNFWDKLLITTGSISVIEISDDLIKVNAINLIDHSPLRKEFYERKRTDTTYHS